MKNLVKMEKEQVKDVAKIHYNSLRDDYLPSLGLKFLENVFYEANLKSKYGETLVYLENGDPAGFVTVSEDSDKFIKDIFIKKFIHALYYGIPGILSSFKLIKESIELLINILKPSSDKDDIKAEIVFIAVDGSYRGRNIGKKLVYGSAEYFSKRGIDFFKTKVLASNHVANSMYQKLGCRIIKEFEFMNRNWVIQEIRTKNILKLKI